MQNLTHFTKNPKITVWIVIAAMLFLSIAALGAVFQGSNSEMWFSMPSLWFFSLIGLPVILYLLIRYYWAKQDRFR